MNPLTNVKNIKKLSEVELKLGIAESSKGTWHNMYKDSAWIFIGGLPFGLTEGDVIAVFSQYGEIVNINLIRDKDTGKMKGYGFLCYEDQRSTILAVDNLNGIKICNRIIRVDHVANYKPPKDHDDRDEITKMLHSEGCAPKEISEPEVIKEKVEIKKKKKKHKKQKHATSSEDEKEVENIDKKKKKSKKHKKQRDSSSSDEHSKKEKRSKDAKRKLEEPDKYSPRRDRNYEDYKKQRRH